MRWAWCQGRDHGTFQRRSTGKKPDFNALDTSQVAGRILQVWDTGQILQVRWAELRLFRTMKLDGAEEPEGTGLDGSLIKGNSLSCRGGVSLVPKGPVAPLLGRKGSDLSTVPASQSPAVLCTASLLHPHHCPCLIPSFIASSVSTASCQSHKTYVLI